MTAFRYSNAWMVKYDPNRIDRRWILEYLHRISDQINIDLNCFKRVWVEFIQSDPDSGLENHYYHDKNDEIHIRISNPDQLISKSMKFFNISIQESGPEIQSVNLLYPALDTDKRWHSIELPSSSLYLASQLQTSGFSVEVNKLFLPLTENMDLYERLVRKYDAIGFSIYEDLIADIQGVSRMVSEADSAKRMQIGGGPMITMAPMRCAYLLDSIDLFINGEAEMILPELLKLIGLGNYQQMISDHRGFLYNPPGLLILSDFNHCNRPEAFSSFNFNLDFASPEQLKRGLEVNLSRGCSRSCIFCSNIQGKHFRSINADKFDALLEQVSTGSAIESPHIFTEKESERMTVNINDDDILQDKVYASRIFDTIMTRKYRIWGIQSALSSFIKKNQIDIELIDMIDIKQLYMNNEPLVWLGTDAFITERGKKLSKHIPDEKTLLKLVQEFEARKIKNIHYWISSDPDSNWTEFIRELILIDRLFLSYPHFDLLAHAPFLVPYHGTPIHRKITRYDTYQAQIEIKNRYTANIPELSLLLYSKIKTAYPNLNQLLDNRPKAGNFGFFDYLKRRDRLNYFMTTYHFLKQERLEMSPENIDEINILQELESQLETILSRLV